MIRNFYAHGKLLLTAEYFVLDGACALATPVKFGQGLTVTENSSAEGLHWQSLDEEGNAWFEADFRPDTFAPLNSSDNALSDRITAIFQEIKKLNPGFRAESSLLQTRLFFPRNWGLGTSSTLIHLLAQWAQVDPFALLANTFGGSGYDLACAGADGPLIYQLRDGKPVAKRIDFHPPFADNLAFVYLGKKQNSRDGISTYRKGSSSLIGKFSYLEKMSALTEKFVNAVELAELEEIIRQHEEMVGEVVGLERAKSLYFEDFWGEVKSLGAWGGDFVMVTSERPKAETMRYFNERGFQVFLQYADMIL